MLRFLITDVTFWSYRCYVLKLQMVRFLITDNYVVYRESKKSIFLYLRQNAVSNNSDPLGHNFGMRADIKKLLTQFQSAFQALFNCFITNLNFTPIGSDFLPSENIFDLLLCFKTRRNKFCIFIGNIYRNLLSDNV